MKSNSHRFVAGLFAFLAVALQGCDGAKNSKQISGNQEQILSGEAEKKFNSWKASPHKNCDAVEIFGNPAEVKLIQPSQPKRTAGIDGTWLYNKLGGKLELVNSANGRILRFATPTAQKPSESSYLGKVIDNLGMPQLISVQALSDGTLCDVIVNGNSLAKIPIYAGIPLAEVIDSARSISHASMRSKFSSAKSREDWTYALFGIDAINRLIADSRAPTRDDIVWASTQLGLLATDPLSVPASRPDGNPPISALLVLQSSPSVPPALNTESNFFWLTRDELAALQPTSTKPVLIDLVRLAEPDFFPGISSREQAQPRVFRQTKATVKLTRGAGICSEGQTCFELSALEELPMQVSKSVDEGISCATAYLNRLRASSPLAIPANDSGYSAPQPRVSDMFGACIFMRPALSAELVTSEAGKEIIQRIYSASAYNFQDSPSWLELLTRSVQQAAEVNAGNDNAKVATILDPQNKIAKLQSVYAYLDVADAALQDQSLLSLQSLAKEVQSAAIYWGLRAPFPKGEHLQRLFRAAAALQTDFPDAAKQLLLSARNDPLKTLSNIEWFTTKMDASIQEIAFQAATESKNKYELKNYINQRRMNLLSERMTAEQWRAIRVTLKAANEFLEREGQRLLSKGEANTGSSFPFIKLVQLAFAESWSQKQFEELESMARLATFDSDCGKTVLASDGISCLGINLFDPKGKNYTALADSHRYGDIADTFVTSLTQLQDPSFAKLRADIVKSFVEPVWKTCSGALLEAKKDGLVSASQKLSTASLDLRPALEVQLRDLLKNCRELAP